MITLNNSSHTTQDRLCTPSRGLHCPARPRRRPTPSGSSRPPFSGTLGHGTPVPLPALCHGAPPLPPSHPGSARCPAPLPATHPHCPAWCLGQGQPAAAGEGTGRAAAGAAGGGGPCQSAAGAGTGQQPARPAAATGPGGGASGCGEEDNRSARPIRSWEKRLAELAKQVGSAGVSQRHKAQAQRRVRTLENQLDKASAKFNSQLALNAGLREELETLRIERGRFEHLYRRLERELQETRKTIGAMIDSSSSAFDARDEAQTKLGQLREKAEKDLAQHGAEMKELQRVLDHDRRLRHFLAVKVQERAFTQEALEAKRKREQEEAEGKRRDPREELLESYEAAFKQIQQLTGEEDLDVLVEKFIAVEDRNFAQFNYVNEQNNELERLGERITQVRRQIQEVRAQEEQEQQDQWAQTRALETQQEEAVQEAQRLLGKEKVVRKILEQLKEGIGSLFRKLGCKCLALDEALGGSAVVRDGNISVFLGLLEQRAHELLAMRAYLASKNYDLPYNPEETARLLLGQVTSFVPPAYPLRPPTAGEEYEAVSEEEERPLTHSELRDRILREVLSKEETPSPKKTLFAEPGGLRAAGGAQRPMEA